MLKNWRRGRDSNPRAGYPTRRFRGAPVTTTSVPPRVGELSAEPRTSRGRRPREDANTSLYLPRLRVDQRVDQPDVALPCTPLLPKELLDQFARLGVLHAAGDCEPVIQL